MTSEQYLGILNYLFEWMEEHDQYTLTAEQLNGIFEALAEGADC